jgi:hypothetical protein
MNELPRLGRDLRLFEPLTSCIYVVNSSDDDAVDRYVKAAFLQLGSLQKGMGNRWASPEAPLVTQCNRTTATQQGSRRFLNQTAECHRSLRRC